METMIRFQCLCGASIQTAVRHAGRSGACPRCSRPLVAPKETEIRAERLAAVPVAAEEMLSLCSICQTPLDPIERRTDCPECRLPFHADCWESNLGCAAYGCGQVRFSKAGPDVRSAAPDMPQTDPAPTLSTPLRPQRFPWEFLVLSASVFALPLGLFSYGVIPLALTTGTAGLFSKTSRPTTRSVLAVAMLVGTVGIVLGMLGSYLLRKPLRSL
jgi:hypothetical protein